MAKLNQIIAIEKGIKSRTYSEFSDLNKAAQKAELFNGFSKTYQKKEEESETFPPESKRVQFTVPDVLRNATRLLTEVMDVTARKDYTNCAAKADVVIDDKVILAGAPVSYLLFLEKQLTDIRTFVANLPILDGADNWVKDANSGLFKTEATQTYRTKKIIKPIVLYPATVEHPAQTQLINEDIVTGFWNQVKQSGAIPFPDKEGILQRIETLSQAVKQAREAANGADEVNSPEVGSAVFGYILGE